MSAPGAKECSVPTRAAALCSLAVLLVAPVAAQAKGPPRLRVENPAALAHDRRVAAAGEAPGPSQPSSAPQQGTFASGGLNQPGLSAGDNVSADQGSPPDTTGAIGPNQYVEFVNSRVAFYNRALGIIGSSVRLSDFVGAPSTHVVFDVQIQWDQQGGRWLYVADDVTSPETTNRLAFGWSQTSDPTGGWCRFFLNSGAGLFDDFPKLGHDDQHVLIGTNVFAGQTGPFVTARIWSIPKPAPGVTSCPGSTPTPTPFPSSVATPLQTHDGNTAFTPVPANTGDGSGTGWVVAADGDAGDRVQVWSVTGSGPSPSLASTGEIRVAPFAPPPLVPQPGTSKTLDSLDGRLTQAVAHADPDAGGAEAVWAQHTIATADGRSAVRWYELLPGSLALRQQGDINDGGLFAFNGSISPTSAGNEAVIQYNTGSSAQLADIRAQSRRSATPLGVMGGEATLGQSSTADQDFTCTPPIGPPCRWGDYSGASPDPGNSALVWGSNQLDGNLRGTAGDPHWLTRNFALVATGRPPSPSIAAPASAGKGDPVRLDASSSTADGPIADYAWDLDGNGSFETDTGTSPVAIHSFPAAGTATVSVRVTDDRGQIAVTTRQIAVADHPPVAALSATPNPAPIPKAVGFDASRSSDVDGRIVDYSWDLDGNGTFETDTGTNPRASRAYRSPGRLTVKLRVRDDDGVTSDATVQLINRTALSLSLKRRQRIGKSVNLRATCSVRCTATFTLQLSKRDARRLHLSRKVGSTKRRLGARKKTSISVALSKQARRRFARLSRVRLSLVAVATDASRSPVRVTRSLTLVR